MLEDERLCNAGILWAWEDEVREKQRVEEHLRGVEMGRWTKLKRRTYQKPVPSQPEPGHWMEKGCQGLIGRFSLVGRRFWIYFVSFHFSHTSETFSFCPPFQSVWIWRIVRGGIFGHIYCYCVLSHTVVALVNFKRDVFRLQNGDTNNQKGRNSDNNKQLDQRILALGFSHCKHCISL